MDEQYVERRFDPGTHFFDQLSVFAVGIAAAYSLVRFKTTSTLASGVVIGGKVKGAILMNPQAIVDSVQGGSLLASVVFEEQTEFSADDYPKEGAAPLGPYLGLLASVCLGSAYESIKPDLVSKYSNNFRVWPREMQYLRHLRIACFHGNRFTITASKKGTPAIDPSNPPKWRSSVMADDNSLNGSRMFFDFLRAGDIPILLADVDKSLRRDGIHPPTETT